MSTSAHTPSPRPAHVPDALVRHFDFLNDEGIFKDPYARLRELHDEPDIFWSTALGGFWVVTRHDTAREILQKPADFSSVPVGLGTGRFPRKLIPVESDPPLHPQYRALAAKIFSPQAIAAKTGNIAQIAESLIDPLVAQGHCEFNEAVAMPMPAMIFTALLGLPVEDWPQFMSWNSQLLHSRDEASARGGGDRIAAYLQEVIADRRRAPRDDLVSALVQGKVEGRALSEEETLDFCFLTFIAGLDTTTGAMGYVFAYLAQHPQQQRELVADPARISGAVEELLRLHATANTDRRVTRDLEVGGVQMKAGDRIWFPFALINRDERFFANPDQADFGRMPNPHFTFGAGAHRCLGSHLARRELNLLLETWMKRIPSFRLAPGTTLRHHNLVFGIDKIPLEWDVK
jgi:cytochrome P450